MYVCVCVLEKCVKYSVCVCRTCQSPGRGPLSTSLESILDESGLPTKVAAVVDFGFTKFNCAEDTDDVVAVSVCINDCFNKLCCCCVEDVDKPVVVLEGDVNISSPKSKGALFDIALSKFSPFSTLEVEKVEEVVLNGSCRSLIYVFSHTDISLYIRTKLFL